jgi:hypothetical protein
VGHPIWCLSGGFLWGLVEAEEVSFGVLECCDEAHALSDFGFGEGDGASGGGDLGEGVVDGVDLDVVHEGLAGVLAGHESAVDAGVSVFGFDGPVVHVPGVGDLPSEGLKQGELQISWAFGELLWSSGFSLQVPTGDPTQNQSRRVLHAIQRL